MSYLTGDISAIQPQINPILNSNNVTTISNHSINDHTLTAIENGINFEYQEALTNTKVSLRSKVYFKTLKTKYIIGSLR